MGLFLYNCGMDILLIVHILAMVMGLGGATYVDMLTFFFARDFHISYTESSVIKFMSKVISIAVIAALLTGVGLVMANPEQYLSDARFLLKVTAFVVVFINGVFLHQIILPKLVNFSLKQDQLIGEAHLSLRKIAFVSGAVSFVSWYTVFLAAMIKNMPFSYLELVGGYVILLLIAVNIALLLEKQIVKKM